MRNISTEIISFTDAAGEVHAVREMTEIPEYLTAIKLKNQKGMMPDEIITRPDVAGAKAEFQTYQIIEANIVDIVESDFDFSRLDQIRIPVTT